jgi:kumamolisin
LTPTEKGQKLPDGPETPMDLQVVHAIAPDAQQVVYYSPQTTGGESYRQVYARAATVFEQADRDYPGAVWSLSFGEGCDTIDRPADLAPVRAAFANAEKHGTSIFVSSGDTGGYECKGYNKFGTPDVLTPPSDGEIGLSSLASVPEATDTGGTTLSTDGNGVWASEQGWAEYPSSQGTGGGVSSLFERPDWQRGVVLPPDPVIARRSIPDPTTQRLTPDVAADADPGSGMATFWHCEPKNCDPSAGGGTSQAAPIWAALTALMNQYLTEHGGHPIGHLNLLLYRIAASSARPAFHDVTLGGNAVYQSGSGFDLATGLGTPDTDNLVRDILDIQRAGG